MTGGLSREGWRVALWEPPAVCLLEEEFSRDTTEPVLWATGSLNRDLILSDSMDDLSDFLCRRTNPRIMSEKRDEPDGQDEVISGIFSELRSIWALKTAQLPPPSDSDSTSGNVRD